MPQVDRCVASFAQERLFLLRELHPSTNLNICVLLTLPEPIAAASIERAATLLIRRHAILRASFDMSGGQLNQVCEEEVALSKAFISLSADTEEAVRACAADIAGQPMDVREAPLFRLAFASGDVRHVIVCMHHLISDGWSVALFVRELLALARAERAADALPELTLQYADFAAWQRQSLEDGHLDEQRAYWRERLQGLESTLDLPVDFARTAAQEMNGGVEQREIPAAISASIDRLCRAEGCSPFMIFLACLDVLLSRLSNARDVSVLAAHAGRNRREVESLIGCFVNPVVLRVGVPPDATFRELLSCVQSTCLSAYEHVDLPFEEVKRILWQDGRGAIDLPIRVFLNMLNLPVGPADAGDAQVEWVVHPEAGAQMDLSFYIHESPPHRMLRIGYNKRLFTTDRIEELARQFIGVVEQALEQPDRPIAEFSLLTHEAARLLPDPREVLSARWEGAVPAIFSGRAIEAPDAPAVFERERTWTYRELDEASDRIAAKLVRRGVRLGEVVAIHAHRCGGLVAAVQGVLKAGASFLVLDASYPRQRLEEYVRLAGARAWIELRSGVPADDELESFARSYSFAAVLGLDGLDRREDKACSSGVPERSTDPLADDATLITERLAALNAESPCYVAFTSGSTGRPKGVLGAHGSLSHFTPWQCRTFALSAKDRFSMLSGVSHDPLHRDMFTPLQIGAAICVPTPDEYEDPLRLVDWLQRSGVTVTHMTPGIARTIAAHAAARSLPLLRLALMVGDVLTRQDVARLRRAAPSLQCVNLYGATETQRAVSYHVVPEVVGTQTPEVLPLGKGVPGVQLLVLTNRDRLAGVGEVGEIVFRSPHIALGYLGDPALTAARFGTNPFTGDSADRLYRTKDLGRYRPNGEVEFTGRSDQQVKIRGYRVELGEVEATLKQHPEISDAVVVPAKDATAANCLVAYVVLASPGAANNSDEWSAFLRARLPVYMLPASFMILEALPLTPQGKLARDRLPLPLLDDGTSSGGAPIGPLESMIAGIWAEVLETSDPIGRNQNFFALGGHSLLATRVMSRLRDAAGVNLPIRQLFEAPTVAGLAAEVQQARGDAGQPLLPVLDARPRSDEPQMSYAQQRLWFLDQLAPLTTSYTLASRWRLTGPLDTQRFDQSVRQLCMRHDVLRTVFRTVGGKPMPVVESAAATNVQSVDLRELSGEARERELARIAADQEAQPFDLANGPLWRVTLVRLLDEEHVAVISLHHIVADGWSVSLLIRELTTSYALATGDLSGSLSPPLQFADYSAWQRELLQGAFLESRLAYWKTQLARVPPLGLPSDRPRPARQTYRGARESVAISAQLARALRRTSDRARATLYMTMLAAWHALLSRYTHQTDFAIGSPIAGRTHHRSESIIGPVFNLLAMRIDSSADLSFIELLTRVRRVVLDAYGNQEMPFDLLVSDIGPNPDVSLSPIFQVLFVLQNHPQAEVRIPGLIVEPLPVESRTAKYDLTLSLTEVGEELQGFLEYSTELFDRATIVRMTGHLERWLEAIVTAPDRRLSSLQFLDDQERARVTLPREQPVPDPRMDASVVQRFTAQARLTPQLTAVVGDEGTATYGQLNRRANRVAARLGRLGVGPEVAVGLCLERSVALVVGVIGVLKAGGAYVPLDPQAPLLRQALMLRDAGVRVVVTSPALAGMFSEWGVLPIDADGNLLEDAGAGCAAESGDEDVNVAIDGANLAYILYTSGATGAPKGVGVEHRQIASYLDAIIERLGSASGMTMAMVQPITVDASLTVFYLSLCTGGCLHLVSYERACDGHALAEYVARHRVDCLKMAPSHLATLLSRGDPARLMPRRLLVLGGEGFPASLAERLRELVPASCVIVNQYGPTETTVGVLTHALEQSSRASDSGAGAGAGATVPIGLPLSGVEAHVVDRRLEYMAVGMPGWLHIGGTQLARGYLGKPALTAERFIPNPFARTPGERLYRTGDLATYRPDGVFECHGRGDHQVKIRGFRVELGEIEAVLRQHPMVSDAVAVLRGEGDLESRLVAYVVCDPHRETGASELREHVSKWLPSHAVPTTFMLMSSLPLTPHGKVAREQLPQPPTPDGAERHGDEPRGPLEEMIATIWGELLGVAAIGRHQGFFELGGHSLLAAQAMWRLREAAEVDLPLRSLFEAPSVAELAVQVDAARREAREAVVPPLRARPRAEGMPLSFAQQRLWFLNQLEPGAHWYSVPVRLRLRGALDVAAFERSLGELVRRHESLRTTFDQRGGEPIQVVAAASTASVRVVDLRDLADGDRLQEVERRSNADALVPFALDKGPLWRVTLLRLEDTLHVALITLHHIISDGWSVTVLIRELATLYAAFAAGRPSPLVDLAVQYADFAAWQREVMQGATLEKHLAYWRRQLANLPAVELPTDRPRHRADGNDGADECVRIEAPAVAGLHKLARDESATVFMVLLGALQVLLSRYTGQDDIVVGCPIVNRGDAALEGVVGFVANTIAVRVDLSGDPTVRALLGRVRQSALDAYTHQDAPFDRVVEELKPVRDTGRNPLVNVILAPQNARDGQLAWGDVEVEIIDSHFRAARTFDLELHVWEEASALIIRAVYSPALFDADTIRRLLGHYHHLVEQFVGNVDARLSSLAMLTSDEEVAALNPSGAHP